jgi:endonuclease III
MRTLAGRSRARAAAVEKISESQKRDPFQILISTLLSGPHAGCDHAGGIDAIVREGKHSAGHRGAARQADRKADLPGRLLSKQGVFVRDAARMIISKFGGRVPSTLEEMITLPGVGRKTANLVMILAFKQQPDICVDVHVHRIANRWVGCGRVRRRNRASALPTLERSGGRLVNLYPRHWGQNVCRPVYPSL